MQQWVQEGRAAELTRRRVERAAEEWSQHHHDNSYLYRGILLAEAQAWAALSVGELSETVRSFLAAGQRYSDLRRYARRRSEERRVGKECRSRGSPYHEKKKINIKEDTHGTDVCRSN